MHFIIRATPIDDINVHMTSGAHTHITYAHESDFKKKRGNFSARTSTVDFLQTKPHMLTHIQQQFAVVQINQETAQD